MNHEAARAGLLVALGAMVIAAPVAAQTGQTRLTAPTSTVLQRCTDQELNAAAERDLIAAIYAAVRALPAERSSSEDIEASIIFAISQRNLCPGVARSALGNIGSGSPAFLQAVSRVRLSLLNGGSVGTAGLANPGGGGGTGASFFSAPMAGVGGGSANYSQ